MERRLAERTLPRLFHLVPIALRFKAEHVNWSPAVNALWDLTAFIDAAGVPDQATAMVLAWGAGTIGNASDFQMQDRNGVLIDTFRYQRLDSATTVGMNAIPFGDLHLEPANLRRLNYTVTGGDVLTFADPWRFFAVYAWF